MRMSLIFLLLFTFYRSTGQSNCRIHNNRGWFSETIELLDSNKFEYYLSSCTNYTKEGGLYNFEDKRLILHFIDTVNSPVFGRIALIEAKPSRSNTVGVKFKVLSSLNNKPVPFGEIVIDNGEGYPKLYETNGDGEAIVSLETASKEVRIKAHGFDHHNFDFPICFGYGDYSITIILTRKMDKIHWNGEEEVYYIRRETDNCIELSLDGFEFIKYQITCR